MANITLGVSSSIALYKACEIVRRFRERGCEVRVIMTGNAAKLVSPIIFEALSGNPVAVELFSERSARSIEHIEIAKWEELFVVAPATANVIGKFTSGIADDFLTTHYLASTAPCLIAPAMNGRMWRAAAVRENVAILENRGVVFIGPKKGSLACGEEDVGALADPEAIVGKALTLLRPMDLRGKNVVVTAGPTREYLDQVRFISNPSTGRMGYRIAEAARRRGAEVTLISGPTEIEPPARVRLVMVETTDELSRVVKTHAAKCDYLFMAAAPSDFSPEKTSAGKRSRKEGPFSLRLLPTADILKDVAAKKKRNQLFCGFAAETGKHMENAKRKLGEKGVDVIALNDVSGKGTGFASEQNEITLVWAGGKTEKLGKASKAELATRLLDAVLKKRGK
jgi:phosphopantothenoylcysteine decarboxylase/phosphopantothenate--cysteine ligase